MKDQEVGRQYQSKCWKKLSCYSRKKKLDNGSSNMQFVREIIPLDRMISHQLIGEWLTHPILIWVHQPILLSKDITEQLKYVNSIPF